MASNLRVDNIQPSTGTGIGIGTANGSVAIIGDLSVDTSKGLTVGAGATISGSTNTIVASTNGSERVRIDSSGNFNLVNTAGVMTAFRYETPALINNYFKSNSTSAGAYVRMYASAGTGQWDIYNNGANLRFSDNASAGNIQMDRPLVMNSQNIVMSSGNGIDFSATADTSATNASSTSELFDDYEEGTWTPTTNGATITVNHARYRKVGGLVYVTCSLDVTVGSGNEAAHIYGLPFSVDSSTGNNYVASESRRINEDPTILYSIGYAASSIANKYVGRQFSSNQINAIFANSTSTGQPSGSASWQINISGVRTVIYGWYIAA